MKKITYFIFATLLLLGAASCSKESEEITSAPSIETNTHRVTIRAGIDVFRTSYDDEGKFSWQSGDKIRVVIKDAKDSLSFVDFTTADTDPVADFSGDVPDGWGLSGLATYPADRFFLDFKGRPEQDKNAVPNTYRFSSSYSFYDENPLWGVPMVGKAGEDGVFQFKSATGILKITINNLPAEMTHLHIISPSAEAPLNGWFDLDEEGVLRMENIQGTPWTDSYNWVTPNKDGSKEFWFFVPVGTIPAGLTLNVCDKDYKVLSSFSTKTEIEVKRNRVTRLAPWTIGGNWESLGMGKFIDNHGFYIAMGWSSATIDAGNDYLDVEIQHNLQTPNEYRIVCPYGKLFEAPVNATKLANASGPSAYLTFQLRDDLGEGIVLNDSYYTGISQYNYTNELWIDNPYWYGYYLYHNNRVIKYAADGTPANIQLAPLYKGKQDDNCMMNPKIEIVFPGAEPMLGGSFNYASNTAVSYADGGITVTMPATAASVKVVVADSLEEGLEALNGDTALTFNESGSQALPLEPGVYTMVYKVSNAAGAFTYKYSEFSNLTKVNLTADMLTINSYAGRYDLTDFYDGGGAGNLVDGDITTYWHSSYYNQYADYYKNDTDYDSEYGICIDIKLSSALKLFKLSYTTRSGNNNVRPREIKFGVSNDGTDWTPIGIVNSDSLMDVGAGQTVNLPNVDPDGEYTYIRIGITKSGIETGKTDKLWNLTTGEGSTALSEIVLYGM